MSTGRWIALGIVLLSAGAVAAVIALRYYPAYRSALEARDDLRAAQEVLRTERLDASAADLALAEGRLVEAESGFRRAHGALDDPVLRVWHGLPLLGDALEAAAGLTEIGREGARLGFDAVAVTRAFQRQRDQGSGPLSERTMELLNELDVPMMAIKSRVNRMREQRDGGGSLLLPALSAAFRELDEALDDVDRLVLTYEDLAQFLPDFLGFDGPRTYLLLAQNNAELLPTGGLISVYGVITVRDGRIESKRFGDALTFGGKWLERTGDYVEPPQPLKTYLLKDVSWNLALSNWSPHFPTTAQQADRLFRLAGGRPVDGVIAINIHTIEALLEVTGPVHIPSHDVVVDAGNAFDVIEAHTRSASEPGGDRKDFVALLADRIFTELMHLPSGTWTSLIEALERLRDEREIAFFSHDREVQALSSSLGIDGALEEPPGDYLMLVDANVHSTKLNAVIEQRIDLAVDIDHDGVVRHRVCIAYSNNLSEWSVGRDDLLVRRLMLDGLYGAYVRLLAPAASQLESVRLAGAEVGPAEIAMEEGKRVFGRYFALPRDQATELAFTYKSFGVVRPEDDSFVYRLYLQRQSGTSAIPVRVRLGLPDGARLRSLELEGAPVDDPSSIETDLAEDRELIVRYELDS